MSQEKSHAHRMASRAEMARLSQETEKLLHDKNEYKNLKDVNSTTSR